MPKRHSLLAGAALAAAGVALIGTSALAQSDDISVYGQRRVGPEVKEISGTVSFVDLDLRRLADRRILAERVKAKARDLCSALGESSLGPPLTPTCEQSAAGTARPQMDDAIASAAARAATRYSYNEYSYRW